MQWFGNARDMIIEIGEDAETRTTTAAVLSPITEPNQFIYKKMSSRTAFHRLLTPSLIWA